MSYEAEGDVVRGRLLTWSEPLVLQGAISWDDPSFNGPAYDPATSASWIRPAIRSSGASWAAIGGTLTTKARALGVLIVQVFVPRGTGDELARQICDAIIARFNRYSSAGVIFRWRGEARPVSIEGDLAQWNVNLPYYRDTAA